jgi:hypothetical protein
MSPPSFLDQLAPELRVPIYGHIFGTSNTIKPSDSTASLGVDKSELNPAALIANPHTPLESSILATNTLIFREAVQVLYHNRVIRATLIDLKHLLQDKNFVANVENVEIADCWNGVKSVYCSGILDKLQELPRINSIVILSDCLGLVDSGLGPAFVSVPRFVENVAGLGHAICIGVGRYRLDGTHSRVHIINRKLTKMWPSAQNVPEGYDAWADLETMMQRWQPHTHVPNRIAMILQTSFRCFVGLYEEILSMEATGSLAELENQASAGTISAVDSARLDLVRHYSGNNIMSPFFDGVLDVPTPSTRSLRNLTPEGDPEVLCWATEFLAANIAASRFHWHPNMHQNFQSITASYWAEADGGMHVIEQKIEHQKLALAGIPNASYILEPVRKNTLIDYSAFKRQILINRVDRLAVPARVEVMEPLEFEKFAHLSIAAFPACAFLDLPGGKEYRKELDVWALNLLKRHLLASKCSDPTMVQKMSLDDLRKSMSLLLNRPSFSGPRTDPPEDLDADLFVPLAWTYGWQYANICADQHEAGREVEEGSDWDEEGSASAAEDEEEEDEGEEK